MNRSMTHTSMALATVLCVVGCQKNAPAPAATQSTPDAILDEGHDDDDTFAPVMAAPEPTPALHPYAWQETHQPTAVNLQRVTFPLDSAALDTQARAHLLRTANVLAEHTDIHVIIAGHADDGDAPMGHLRLGQQRADAVRDYLIDHEVDPHQLMTVTVGHSDPLVPATGPHPVNRRVEFVVVSDPDGIVDASTDDPIGGAGPYDTLDR